MKGKLHKRQLGSEHHTFCRHCGEGLQKEVIGYEQGLCSDCYQIYYYYNYYPKARLRNTNNIGNAVIANITEYQYEGSWQ